MQDAAYGTLLREPRCARGLGRIIRDVRCKIEADAARQDRFGPLLDLASQEFAIKSSASADRRSTLWHAPEVECIGPRQGTDAVRVRLQGVDIATPATAPKGGQFVLHAKALHGNPYDGHTLGPVITDLEKLTGVNRPGRHSGSARAALERRTYPCHRRIG